jgi:hypothetical protein
MIERFQYYLDKGLARKVTIDREEAKSLMKKAVHRLEYVKRRKPTRIPPHSSLKTFTRV